MLSERIRSRLAELNRAPLPRAEAAPAPSALRAALAPPLVSDANTAARHDPLGSDGQEVETPSGKCWVIQRPVAALWDQSLHVIESAQQSWRDRPNEPGGHEDWQRFRAAFCDECALLDLETCGFAGSMVFLVGVIHEADGRLVLSQILARNYAEEAAMLFTLWEIMRSRGVLLTFNGKSFDWPMVTDRSVLHRLDAAGHTRPLEAHIDLLHHARRRYRRELPNCKLQTLEWYLCGRRRTGDIPGSEIPDAYHHYVRTGQQGEMRSILHHNALDLITLLQLSLRMATAL